MNGTLAGRKYQGGLRMEMKPYYESEYARLYLGDVLKVLRRLPARSVHTVITSPPYYALRDYRTASWEGGNSECDHIEPGTNRGKRKELPQPPAGWAERAQGRPYTNECNKCGAKRIDQQLGSEERPDCLGWASGNKCGECFVCHMIEVFAEVRRVLRDDGTCWLNLGDSYSGGKTGQDSFGDSTSTLNNGGKGTKTGDKQPTKRRKPSIGIPQGNLVGIPWRVALALQANGWILRQDVIWHKPAPMPESVENRCTKAHEYIFLLTKSQDYYFDNYAIKEDPITPGLVIGSPGGSQMTRTDRGDSHGNDLERSGKYCGIGGRNKRDVWTVSSRGYSGAHFATFSPELITPCILAGSSEHGCCAECGKPYERVVTRTGYVPRTQGGDHFGRGNPPENWEEVNGKLGQHRDYPGNAVRETVGWRKVCGCRTDRVSPCVVFDPFVGSGTTPATAILHGRIGWGIDLSEDYLRDHAIPRVEAAIKGEKLRAPTVVVPDAAPPPPKRLRGS